MKHLYSGLGTLVIFNLFDLIEMSWIRISLAWIALIILNAIAKFSKEVFIEAWQQVELENRRKKLDEFYEKRN